MIAFLHRGGGELADVGAAFLLGHELAALGQLAHVGLGQSVEISRFQRLVAEARQQLGATVGDIDRATQAELGLVEQKREGVLGHHRISPRPAQNALANRHRMDAEFAERGALQFAIGRMILDPLGIAAEAVALMQLRHMPVGQPRAFVEMTAGERSQPIEMRLDMAEQRIGQMNPQADRSAPDPPDKNSCLRYRAPAIPAGRSWRPHRFCLAAAFTTLVRSAPYCDPINHRQIKPATMPSRNARSEDHPMADGNMADGYRIFGAEMSPYSVKIRSYFRYKAIPHQWILRNAGSQTEYEKYAKMPDHPSRGYARERRHSKLDANHRPDGKALSGAVDQPR